jgi:hypothetical protein
MKTRPEFPLQNRKKTRQTGETGKKMRQRPKIPRIAGEQMPGRKHKETGK